MGIFDAIKNFMDEIEDSFRSPFDKHFDIMIKETIYQNYLAKEKKGEKLTQEESKFIGDWEMYKRRKKINI